MGGTIELSCPLLCPENMPLVPQAPQALPLETWPGCRVWAFVGHYVAMTHKPRQRMAPTAFGSRLPTGQHGLRREAAGRQVLLGSGPRLGQEEERLKPGWTPGYVVVEPVAEAFCAEWLGDVPTGRRGSAPRLHRWHAAG